MIALAANRTLNKCQKKAGKHGKTRIDVICLRRRGLSIYLSICLSIYSSNRKDRRYSTNILYRRCQFGGLKSTNHIEDNACSKSSPKQVFRGFQPNFWSIIFYMICKWTVPSTSAIHWYLQCFWPFWPNFLGYFRGTAQMPECPYCPKVVPHWPDLGGNFGNKACWSHLGKKTQKTLSFFVFFWGPM